MPRSRPLLMVLVVSSLALWLPGEVSAQTPLPPCPDEPPPPLYNIHPNYAVHCGHCLPRTATPSPSPTVHQIGAPSLTPSPTRTATPTQTATPTASPSPMATQISPLDPLIFWLGDMFILAGTNDLYLNQVNAILFPSGDSVMPDSPGQWRPVGFMWGTQLDNEVYDLYMSEFREPGNPDLFNIPGNQENPNNPDANSIQVSNSGCADAEVYIGSYDADCQNLVMSLNGTLDGSEFLPQHASVIFPDQNFILASAAKLADENTEWIGGDLIVGEILYFVMYRSLIEIVTETSPTPTATETLEHTLTPTPSTTPQPIYYVVDHGLFTACCSGWHTFYWELPNDPIVGIWGHCVDGCYASGWKFKDFQGWAGSPILSPSNTADRKLITSAVPEEFANIDPQYTYHVSNDNFPTPQNMPYKPNLEINFTNGSTAGSGIHFATLHWSNPPNDGTPTPTASATPSPSPTISATPTGSGTFPPTWTLTPSRTPTKNSTPGSADYCANWHYILWRL